MAVLLLPVMLSKSAHDRLRVRAVVRERQTDGCIGAAGRKTEEGITTRSSVSTAIVSAWWRKKPLELLAKTQSRPV